MSTGYNDATVNYDAALLYDGSAAPDPTPTPLPAPLTIVMPTNENRLPARYVLPPIESGYHLDPAVGFFSAILPLGADKTNIVANPSVETGTTGYSVNLGGTVARDTSVQKFGVASLKCTPSSASTDGWKYDTVSLTSGVQYFASVWFKGQAGLKYRLDFLTTGGVGLGAPTRFTANGFWQRVSVTYLETSTTTRRIYLRKDNQTNTTPFWTDGLQVERDQLTTYFDGDMVGFVRGRADFYWTGTPHASTSVRSGQTRAGGAIVSLDKFGFRLLSIIGLGLGGIVNQMTPLARGGAYYGGTVIADRSFTLVGQIDDPSGYLGMARKRQGLIDLFKPDVVSPEQPVVLRYTPTDDCGNPAGNEQEIVCVLEGDLSARTDNLNAERIGLAFRLYLPFVMQEVGNVAASAGYSTTITNVNYILGRQNGVWSNLGATFDNAVYVIKADPLRGRIYIGGDFSTPGAGICYYDTTTGTFGTLGAGANSRVDAIAIAANGDVWAGGTFTTIGGAATKGIGRWNFATSTWTAFNVATTTGGTVYDLDIDAAGNVYVGSNFTNWDGIAAADYAFRYTAAGAWDAIGPGGFNFNVFAVKVDADGSTVWFGGAFTAPDLRLVAYSYFLAAFVSVGKPDAQINDIDINAASVTAVGGTFTTIGGEAIPYVATDIGDGANWAALGSGVNGNIYSVRWNKLTNDMIVAGDFDQAGGLTIYDNVALFTFNGGWSTLSVNLPGTPIVTASDWLRDDIYIGFTTTGSAVVPGAVTTLNNTGSTKAWPKITLTGPGTVLSIRNLTTGKSLYFNMVLQAGETAVLDINPSQITFVSSFLGNILGKITPASDLSNFFLAPGNNQIAVAIDDPTAAATAVTLAWRVTSHSLDAAVPGRLLP